MNTDARDWLQEKQQSLNIAKDCLQEVMIRQASNADRPRLEGTFLENQEVLVHRDHIGVQRIEGQPCAKLRHRWIGPFKILQVLSPTTVKLELPFSIRVNPVFNVSVLKHYEAPTPEELDETLLNEHEASAWRSHHHRHRCLSLTTLVMKDSSSGRSCNTSFIGKRLSF